MNKRTMMIGAAVLIVGLIAWVAIGLTAQIPKLPPVTYDNFTMRSGGFNVFNISISNTTYVFLVEASFSEPINAYVFSGNSLGTWKASLISNSSGLVKAEALEGNGLIVAYTNLTTFVLPGTSNNGNLVYVENGTSTSGNAIVSNYSIVFENSNGNVVNAKPVSVTMGYIRPQSLPGFHSGTSLSNYLLTIEVAEATFFIMMLVGLGIVIYGVIRKPRTSAKVDQGEIEERDRLYGNARYGSGRRGRK